MRSPRQFTAEYGRAVSSQVRHCRVRSARVITFRLTAEELPLHVGALLDQLVLTLVRSRQVGHHDVGKGARSLGGKAAADLASSKGRSTLWALGRRRAFRWRLCCHVGFHHLLHLELRGCGGFWRRHFHHLRLSFRLSDLPRGVTNRDEAFLATSGTCLSQIRYPSSMACFSSSPSSSLCSQPTASRQSAARTTLRGSAGGRAFHPYAPKRTTFSRSPAHCTQYETLSG